MYTNEETVFKRNTGTYVVSFSIDQEHIDYLAEIMAQKGCSRSEAIRYLIKMGRVYVTQVLPAQENLREEAESD